MLEPDSIECGGGNVSCPSVRRTGDLPGAGQFWMAYVARDLLRLGVFFRAAAIMLQIPGAGRYRVLHYDNVDDNLPDWDEDPSQWLGEVDRDTVFDVLAECLRRLGAEELMQQVTGGEDFEQEELSEEWVAYLDRHAGMEHGLLNVVAECLDELIVRPGMKEIDIAPRASWWQQWWGKLR